MTIPSLPIHRRPHLHWGRGLRSVGLGVALIACGGGGADKATSPSGSPSGSPSTPPATKTPAKVVLSGSSQTVDPGATLQLSASVQASDGTQLSGIALTYSSSTPTVATVNQSGLVTGTNTAGSTNITASTGSITSNAYTVTVPNLAGVAKTMLKAKDVSQSLPVGTSDSVKVKVLDIFGAPVGGVQVTFTSNIGCASTAPQTATTDATGIAGANFQLRTQAGQSCMMTATAPSLTTLTFSASSIAGPATSIQFTSPVTGGRMLTMGLGVTLTGGAVMTDTYGNGTSTPPPFYVSRNPAVVSAVGTSLIGMARGQAFVVATAGSASDSILVGVGQYPSGVVVAPLLPRADLKTDTVFTVPIRIQSFDVRVGSATVVVTWDPNVLTFVSETPTGNGTVVVNTNAVSSGTMTIAYANAGASSTGFNVRSLTFRAASVAGRIGSLNVNVVDMTHVDTFVDLLPVVQSVSFPVRTR